MNLAAVIAAAIAGAIVGDSIGYTVGRRYGPHLLAGRAGRLVKTEHPGPTCARCAGYCATQVAWLGRLLESSGTGLPRTATLAGAALAVWLFAGLTQDVLAREELALDDPRVHAFVVAPRSGWLTTTMRTLTWLGASYTLIPVLLSASVFLPLRRRDRWAMVRLWAAYLGAGAAVQHGQGAGAPPPPPGGRHDRTPPQPTGTDGGAHLGRPQPRPAALWQAIRNTALFGVFRRWPSEGGTIGKEPRGSDVRMPGPWTRRRTCRN